MILKRICKKHRCAVELKENRNGYDITVQRYSTNTREVCPECISEFHPIITQPFYDETEGNERQSISTLLERDF